MAPSEKCRERSHRPLHRSALPGQIGERAILDEMLGVQAGETRVPCVVVPPIKRTRFAKWPFFLPGNLINAATRRWNCE